MNLINLAREFERNGMSWLGRKKARNTATFLSQSTGSEQVKKYTLHENEKYKAGKWDVFLMDSGFFFSLEWDYET